MGTEGRRFTIKLPRVFADMCGEETVTITEEREGLSGAELTYWLAYYELENAKNAKKK